MTHLLVDRPRPAPAILVVDNDPQIRRLMHAFLTQASYEVYVTASAASAVELLRERDVALLIVDLFMPEQDGFEIIRVIRRIDRKCKILAISGHAEPFLRIAAELGADAVISKPFRQEELLAKIYRLLAEPAAT